jgi:hypothetical protein
MKKLIVRALPGLAAFIIAVFVFIGLVSANTTFIDLTAIVAVTVAAFTVSMIVILVVWKQKTTDELKLAAEPGGTRELAQFTLDKYEVHTLNARFSMGTLIVLTVSCLFIIIFARYFLVIDQLWSSQVGTGVTSPLCSAFNSTRFDDAPVAREGETEALFTLRLNAYYSQLKAYTSACENESIRLAEAANNDRSADDEVEPFWPVLLLRASVLAFMLFVMFFFIRDYQYETAVANRYFSIFSGLLSDKDSAELLRTTRKEFDAGDIKFGVVRSSPAEQIVNLPRDFMALLRAEDKARPSPAKNGRATSAKQAATRRTAAKRPAAVSVTPAEKIKPPR